MWMSFHHLTNSQNLGLLFICVVQKRANNDSYCEKVILEVNTFIF